MREDRYFDYDENDRRKQVERISSFADPARGREALTEAIFRRLTAELDEDASLSRDSDPPSGPQSESADTPDTSSAT